MQYTFRNIPKHIDKALRAKAKAQKKSLNQLGIEAFAREVGIPLEAGKPKRDLSFMGGMDDETYRAIQAVREESERIWPENGEQVRDE
jgi:hypothetical protein